MTSCVGHWIYRTGFLCKDYIDGFGVWYTSLDYQCYNCSNIWYGVPLYLVIEFLPATIFLSDYSYFQHSCNICTFDLLGYVCQLFTADIVSDRSHPLQLIIPVIKHRRTFGVALGFFGIWNLDYFRYVLPPFCISSKLNLRHFIQLEYLSAFYPFHLILLTWIFVKLYERGIMRLKGFCALKSRWFGRLSRHLSVRNGVINSFATFFLLSYTKLMHQSVLLLHCSVVYSLNNGKITKDYVPINDPTSKKCANIMNYLLAIPVYAFFSIIPIMILILYPFKIFKTCLLKCKLNRLALNGFIEKFHSCYKDGSTGGKDMRSVSGLYFVLRHLIFLRHFLFSEISYWYYQDYLFMVVAVLIGYLKPYKESYMNFFDTFLTCQFAVTCYHESTLVLKKISLSIWSWFFYQYLDCWLVLRHPWSSIESLELNIIITQTTH